MDLLEQVIPEAIGALLATAILAFLAWLRLRHRSRKRYLPDLTAESKEILIGLWDGLLRRPNKLTEEFGFDERLLKKSLNQLASYGFVEEERGSSGVFWKITRKGQDYLRRIESHKWSDFPCKPNHMESPIVRPRVVSNGTPAVNQHLLKALSYYPSQPLYTLAKVWAFPCLWRGLNLILGFCITMQK